MQNKYFLEENIMENKTPNTKDFEEALSFIFKYKTICENADYVEIQSDKLHEFVGGYPAKDGNHRMPICCAAMRKFITENDEILNASPSGQSSKLLIRYKLPRNS